MPERNLSQLLSRLKHAFVLMILLYAHGSVFSQTIYRIDLNESINPAVAEFVQSTIKTAEKDSAEAILIRLNTPGGLLESTRHIVTDIMSSSVPVIVFIAPSGARAGSAGVFITMSAHIAAMAPGTNIGAAHPVSMQGQGDPIVNEKSTNDAAAFIRSIAEKRNRNVMWAEDAVRMSVAITETEALSENVINLIAESDADLMSKVNGLSVTTTAGSRELRTAGAEIKPVEMGFFLKVLSRLSDPNIAYVLMMIGFFGLIFELFSPGAIFPGIVGVVSLILAFYTMSTLPVNYAAVALIVFGIVLYLLEIKVTSHGMLAIGGTISVLLGSMFLFRSSSTESVTALSWTVIITTTLVTLLFFLFVVGMGLRAQKLKPASHGGGLIGRVGVSVTTLDPEGMVRVGGETWKALSDEGRIDEGREIIVSGMKGLTLHVSTREEQVKS